MMSECNRVTVMVLKRNGYDVRVQQSNGNGVKE
jgi:hypothetical protein